MDRPGFDIRLIGAVFANFSSIFSNSQIAGDGILCNLSSDVYLSGIQLVRGFEKKRENFFQL